MSSAAISRRDEKARGHRLLEARQPQHRGWLSQTRGLMIANGNDTDSPTIGRQKQLVRTRQLAPKILYRPSSPDNTLRIKTAHLLQRLCLQESWFGFLPSRLGSNPAIDTAIDAFYKVNTFALAPGSGGVSANTCLTSYTRAISGLRQIMSTSKGARSDEALLACALLAYCEWPMALRLGEAATMSQTASHLYGIQAIMTSRPPNHGRSRLAQEIALWQSEMWMDALIDWGLPSPFEKLTLSVELAPTKSLPSAQDRLKELAQGIFVRLPRLIMYLKDLRTDTRSLQDQKVSFIDLLLPLAKECLSFKDGTAEDALLHRVKVNKSQEARIATPIPYSFTFQTLGDFDAAIYYWQARLLVLRICWQLSAQCDEFSEEVLAKEGVRTLQNVLMSWQYGIYEAGLCGMFRLLHVLPALWGGLKDLGNPSKVSLPRLRTWLLIPANELYGEAMRGPTPSYMDQQADIYIGGEAAITVPSPFTVSIDS